MDLMIAFGNEIKAVGDGKIEGYLCRFSTSKDPDLEGDFFTADTDFGIHTKLPLYYQHGFDGKLKSRRIGQGDCRKDETGVWFEAQMEMRDDYERMIYDMIAAGKLGYSSGAIGHLVEREQVGKSYWLKSWPLGEASATPTPAEPRNTILTAKAFLSETEGEETDVFKAELPALDDIDSEREFEFYLRARGCAREESKALVAIAKRGFKALCQREAEETAKVALIEQIARDRALLELSYMTGV